MVYIVSSADEVYQQFMPYYPILSAMSGVRWRWLSERALPFVMNSGLLLT